MPHQLHLLDTVYTVMMYVYIHFNIYTVHNSRSLAHSTIDVKGVAVLWTLISTLTEELYHFFWLPTKHQLSTTHYSYSAEHLEDAHKEILYFIQSGRKKA